MSVCVGISDEIATIATDEAAIALPFQLSLATLQLRNDIQETRKKCAARSCLFSRFRRRCSCANAASSIEHAKQYGRRFRLKDRLFDLKRVRRIKTKLNARMTIRQKDDLFGANISANEISFRQDQTSAGTQGEAQ